MTEAFQQLRSSAGQTESEQVSRLEGARIRGVAGSAVQRASGRIGGEIAFLMLDVQAEGSGP
ncbi:hypothetical protein D3C75_1055700 [compost metagenome]